MVNNLKNNDLNIPKEDSTNKKMKDRYIIISSPCSIGTKACFDYINPENIKVIATAVTAGVAITSTIISAIKLWVEDRKNKKIKFRSGENEIEIAGHCSLTEIEERLKLFNRFIKENPKEKKAVIIVDEYGTNKLR